MGVVAVSTARVASRDVPWAWARGGGDVPNPRVERTTKTIDAEAPDVALLCRGCSAPITMPRHRIEVLGAHEHRFMNQAGNLFHLGCFAEAPGCAVVGPPSDEYPWFPRYSWRFAMCGACALHLGWYFQSEAGSFFFGLRLDRLREAAAGLT